MGLGFIYFMQGGKMDTNELKEKEEHEKDKASKILISTSKEESVGIKEFYPELNLNGVYGYYIFGRPVYTLIPYMDNVIISLPPYREESLMKEKLGIDLSALLELKGKKRVSIVLDSNPLEYKNLDYLDPIIEVAPSAEIRNYGYLSAISPSYQDYYSNSKSLFSGRLGSLSKNIEWNRFVNQAGKEMEHTGINMLSQIGALGYHNTYNGIVEKGKEDPVTAYRWAYYYSTFLADPVFCSLDGITPIDRNMIKKELNAIKNKLPGLQPDKRKFLDFPTDVGRAILDKYKICLPRELDTALRADGKKLRQVLYDVDQKVEGRGELVFEDRQQAIAQAVDEVKESVQSLDSTTMQKPGVKKTKMVIDLALGVTGIASMFMTKNPMFLELATLGISIDSMRVPEIFQGSIKRIKKTSHIVAMLGNENSK